MAGWRPPELIELAAVGAVVRRYRLEDADAVHDAIETSREHLRPYMFWAEQSRADTRRFIAEAVADWDDGRNWNYGIFEAESDVYLGGSGLHPRSGPDVLEIGYWRTVGVGGRGVVTATARALTTAAFTNPAITRVEIHCDVTNRASAAVPQRLGYAMSAIVEKEPVAPGETGRQQVWVTGRPSAPLADRLRAALGDAMRVRDRTAMTALRSALGAIDNAAAVPAVEAGTSSNEGPIAGATAGVGATEVARRELVADDVAAIVRAQIDERHEQAEEFDRLGQGEAAETLRAEAAALTRALDRT